MQDVDVEQQLGYCSRCGQACSLMGAPMICPVCLLKLDAECRGVELTVNYNVKDWMERCTSREHGDPVLCKNLRPTILKSLAEAKDHKVRSGELETGKDRPC